MSQMQVEIEKSSKMLNELESETANTRNQLTSVDSQKMKLVQEGTAVYFRILILKIIYKIQFSKFVKIGNIFNSLTRHDRSLKHLSDERISAVMAPWGLIRDLRVISSD